MLHVCNGMLTYITVNWAIFRVNVGKYSIPGASGNEIYLGLFKGTINEDLWVSMGVFFSNNQMLLSEGVFHISGMVLYGCFQKWRYPQMNGL